MNKHRRQREGKNRSLEGLEFGESNDACYQSKAIKILSGVYINIDNMGARTSKFVEWIKATIEKELGRQT